MGQSVAAQWPQETMEITEQWIGKAAGGRVFKEARTLLRMRKVIQVTRTEGVFQGTLDIGKRPMRVVVKVLGANEVRNHCGCALTRRTGALCEHATALMLASVLEPDRMPGAVAAPSPGAKPSPAKSVDPVALEVRLSPQFPIEGQRAAHLKKIDPSDASTDAADVRLTTWLLENTGHAGDAMLSIPEDKLAGFFRALDGHQRVSRGEQKMEIISGRLRPVMQMQVDGSTARMRMLGDGLMTLGQAMVEWNQESSRLVVDPSDNVSGSPTEWQEMKTKALIKMLPALAEMYQLPDDLGGLKIKAAVPEIELLISGSTRALQAQLVAKYPGDVKVTLAVSKAESDTGFPIESDEEVNLWWVRHPEQEQVAVAEVMQAGFQILDASGMLFLRGEDEVLDFLTSVLPGLRKKWTVHTEAKLGRVESRVERIVPRISLQESSHGAAQGSGEDWLACDVSWQCGDQVLSSEAVRKLLMSGSRSMVLPRGGTAVISHFDAEVMEGFMLDTDPMQEGGAFRFPAQQSAYLEGLRSYYSADSGASNQELLPVPDLPTNLLETLRDYQWEGVQWLYRRLVQVQAA